MNSNTLIFILAVVMSFTMLVVSEKSKKEKIERRKNSISNKLNSNSATISEIKLAYKYETGLNPFYTTHKEGTSLEYEIFKILYRFEGKVLSNLYVNKIDDSTSEIDVLFIHNTGIYVLECKDIRAIEIIGDEQDIKWDCIYRKKKIRKMYNPLKQNLGHIATLKNALRDRCRFDCFNSVVVINCTNVKSRYTSNFDNYNQRIVTPQQLKNYIESLIKDKERIFSDEEVLDIYKYIHENYANVSNKVKKVHKQRVNNIAKQIRS